MVPPSANDRLPGAMPSPGGNLPRAITSLVGRDDDIAAVSTLTRRDDVPLLTLIGPGGVGKTRLAMEVARGAASNGFDLVGFAPLAAIRDPALVPQAIAQALAIAPAAEKPILDRIPEFIADRRVLLVMDNLEHVPAAAPLLADLLGNCPNLTILATSRVRLNLSGERLYPVLPLGMASASELFTQRSMAVEPGFRLDAASLPTVEAICLRVDCLPLAIELAAARLTVLSFPALLARLDRPLGLLTGGPHDAPDRQRTMRHVIAWSHDLLPANAQALLRRLGVFVGGFTLAGAAAVAGTGEDVLDDLDALLNSSLVQRAPPVTGVPRFTMLETIREFSLELLSAFGEESATRKRLAMYLAEAMEHEVSLQNGPGLRAAHDRVEAELQNCRVALAWCLESREAELGIRIAGGVWRTTVAAQSIGDRPWLEQVSEGRRWLEATLAMREGIPLSAQVEALQGVSSMAGFMGDNEAAEAFARELLDRSLAEGNTYGIYLGHIRLGNISLWTKDFETVRHHYLAALAETDRLPHRESRMSQTLSAIGLADEGLGASAAAREHFEEAMSLARISANPYAISLVGWEFASFLRRAGELVRATEVLGETVSAYVEERRIVAIGETLSELALVAQEGGQLDKCRNFQEMAEQFARYTEQDKTAGRSSEPAYVTMPEPAFHAIWSAENGLDQTRVLAEIADLAAALNGSEPVEEEAPEVRRFGLTRRELEVLRLLAEGRSNRAIADELSLSERTVEHHLLHTYTKLGLESRAAAVAFALRHGLA